MNPSCSKCKKTVLPTDKLNCLDKIWHAKCFTCTMCDELLDMKTYKGYKKQPYCDTHYPTTKFTAVSDTPENLRLQQQVNNQKELVYHGDMKDSRFSEVTDTEAARKQMKPKTPPPKRKTAEKPPPQPQPPAAAQPNAPKEAHVQYKAIYDYAAADDDEISFNEGDAIIEVTVIDDGWMEGRVKRTGQYGMLPSNYVEKQ